MRNNPQIAVDCPLSPEFLRQLVAAGITDEGAFEIQVDKTKTEEKNYSGIYKCIGQDLVVFVKCYMPGGSIARVLANSGQRTAQKVFDLAASLAGQLPVAQPFSLVRNLQSGNVYYFSEFVRGCSFAEYMRQNEGQTQLVQKIVESAAGNLALLHQQGLVHGDFKWTNLIVTFPEQAGASEVFLIDLDGAAHSAHKPAARGRDIARFIVNARDINSPQVVEEWFFHCYSESIGEDVESVVKMATPSINKLQKRHRRKYGK